MEGLIGLAGFATLGGLSSTLSALPPLLSLMILSAALPPPLRLMAPPTLSEQIFIAL